MVSLPTLDDADEIRKYISSHPTESLKTNEIVEEIKHWHRLFNDRLWQECHRANNPGDKGEIFRWGSNLIAILGIPALFVAPPVAAAFAFAALGLNICNEIMRFLDGRHKREEPVRLAYERGDALIRELETRSIAAS